MDCALGLSVHTGWAACVAACAGAPPQVVLREEVRMLDDPERFVFHRAAKMSRGEGEKSVARALAAARAGAEAQLGAIAERLEAAGHRVTACAILAKPGELPSFEDIVAAHPRIHTAEGVFYRDVLRAAAEARRIPTRVLAPSALEKTAASALRLRPERVAALLAEAGRVAGRPWAKDQKTAALAAWTALAK
jgi:hypothetical protein